jgi:CxxC-x17-CxxC domain-containing protein
MPDFELVCADCGENFVFDEKEQHFYRERKMRAPRRCRNCRYTRRLEQTDDDGLPQLKPGADKHLRFQVVCDKCGKDSFVPFKPAPGRAVLCYDCYNARRAALAADAGRSHAEL